MPVKLEIRLMSLRHKLASWLGGRSAYRFHLRYWFDPDPDIAAGLLSSLKPARALQAEISNGPSCKRLTVIAPHPDDEIIGPGGTLILSKGRGVEISVIFLTDGETDKELAKKRRQEAEAVALKYGFDIEFLGLPANELNADIDATQALLSKLAEQSPQTIMVPFFLDDNDDHQAAARLLAKAAPELDNSIEVWAYQVYSALPANILVPLGEAAKTKADAIRMYTSQMEVRDWANYALGLNAYNTRLAPRRCRDQHLETFYALPLNEYAALCQKIRFRT